MPITGVALSLSLMEFAAVRDWTVVVSGSIEYTAGDEEVVIDYEAGSKRKGMDFFFCEIVVGGEIAGRYTIYHDVYENGTLKESKVIATLHITDFGSQWFTQPLPLRIKNGDHIRVTFYHGQNSGRIDASIFGFESNYQEIISFRNLIR